MARGGMKVVLRGSVDRGSDAEPSHRDDGTALSRRGFDSEGITVSTIYLSYTIQIGSRYALTLPDTRVTAGTEQSHTYEERDVVEPAAPSGVEGVSLSVLATDSGNIQSDTRSGVSSERANGMFGSPVHTRV